MDRSRRGVIPRVARIIAVLALAGAIGLAGAWVGPRLGRDVPPVPGDPAYLRAEGGTLVRDGAPFRLKAVGFANDYSRAIGEDGFSLDDARHHSERDLARVADLGFNAIRFGFNGGWLRDDPRGFWDWLDGNLAWAERHGLLVTLDLHVPIGGDWLDASAPSRDFRIWTDPDVRAETVEMWRRIAARYRDVPTVAGYDILNEPVTVDATGDQWRALAAEIVAAIRAVDPNHLLIVGPVYGTGGAYGPVGPEDQFLVDDDNVLYDFHFYEPIDFTHQTAGWLAQPIVDGGTYPDPRRFVPTGAQVLIEQARVATPRLAAGDSDWTAYDSGWVAVAAPAVAALPTAVMQDGARGRVRFDAVEVFERDAASGQVTRVVEAPLGRDDVADWWPWGGEAAGARATFERADDAGATGGASLAIAGAAARGTYLGWSSDALWIRVTPGNSYRISGRLAGVQVGYQDGSDGYIGLALDLYADPDGGTAVLSRSPAYLAHRFAALRRFGEVHDVPMSVMEFGTIDATLGAAGSASDKGGARWISDMLDLFDRHDTSYALWAWVGPSMGLYLGDDGSGTARPNLPLIEVMRAHQRGGGG